MSEGQVRKKRSRYRSRAEADLLAAEFEAGSQTRQAFCEQRNLALKTLARYLTRYRQSRAADGESARWLSVEVKPAAPRGCQVSVLLAGGRRVEVAPGFDPATLREVVRALEQL